MRAIHFISSSILLSLSPFAIGCPNKCSRNGACTPDSICECHHGWSGGDCSIRICPSGSAFSDLESSTVAHQGTVCSGRGTCDDGLCLCNGGFTGIACERTKCKNNCSSNGQCVSMKYLADNTRNHQSQQYTYNLWDAEMVYGCVCDEGYDGYDCSLQSCPRGDDPLTTTNTAQEIQLLRCTADNTSGGNIVLYYDGKPSTSIPVDASTTVLKSALESISLIDSVDVSYTEQSVLCRNDGVDNIVSITFTSNFGPLPPLVSESFGMEPSSTVEIAAGDSYGMLTDHNGIVYTHTKGDKENDECSNRGLCDQDTGTCKCFDSNGDAYAGSDGYGGSGSRGDCGHVVSAPVTTCPGEESPCSGHGACDLTTFRCSCEDGYTGGDCSQRTCEKGLAWFDYPSSDDVAHDIEVECSNMGICQRTIGECQCNKGFFGAACQFMGCVGDASASPSEQLSCNDHGSCLSIRELGLEHTDTDGISSPILYGVDPNDASTWDADRIFGCKCDEKYEGYDCSMRTCAEGVDINVGDTNTEQSTSLTTQFDGPNTDLYADSDKFSIIAGDTAVTIESIDIHMAAVTENVEVWTKSGYPLWWDDGSYTKVWEGTVVGQGQGVATSLPEFDPPIEIGANSILGVYLMVDTQFQNNVYHSSGSLGDTQVFATDGIISITEGISQHISHSSFQQPTRWNGLVHYSCDGGCGAPTPELHTCSNHGICDHTSGQCECFKGWGSSDGSGNLGSLNDCGHRLKLRGYP